MEGAYRISSILSLVFLTGYSVSLLLTYFDIITERKAFKIAIIFTLCTVLFSALQVVFANKICKEDIEYDWCALFAWTILAISTIAKHIDVVRREKSKERRF